MHGLAEVDAGGRAQFERTQKQLRAETYDQLIGALREGEQPADIGRRVVCPASVKGSRRAMYKLFLDCMAIVRKFGSPHLFITVRHPSHGRGPLSPGAPR